MDGQEELALGEFPDPPWNLSCCLMFSSWVRDPVDSKPESSNTTVPVGYTLDLNPDTPLCSLSCAATFAKKFPSESSRFYVVPDRLLISSPHL